MPASIQVTIKEGLSVLFTGSISDWIGLFEGIASSCGDAERVGCSIYDDFCDIPRGTTVAGDRMKVSEEA